MDPANHPYNQIKLSTNSSREALDNVAIQDQQLPPTQPAFHQFTSNNVNHR